MKAAQAAASSNIPGGIPTPIVTFNRWVLAVGIVAAFLLQQPLITTALFVVLLGAIVFGPRGSLIHQVGRRLFAKRIPTAPREDRRLMRFNNSIAVVMLGSAQIAFLVGLTALGWVLALVVALAAAVALAGFCFGCFLFFQFKLQRYRLFNGR